MDAKLMKLLEMSRQVTKETQTLYEIGDAEMLFMVNIVQYAVNMGLTTKTTVKILKAAAHFIEAGDELADKFAAEFNKS
jgi:hypothetical protein